MSKLRRADRKITDPAEIERLLQIARYATVALADGAEPYLVTLSCGYDAARRRLCFHVAPKGRKLDVIVANARGCATVIEDLGYQAGQCKHHFRSVVMTGTLRVLTDPGDIRAAMLTLIGQLESPADTADIWQRNRLDDPACLERFRALVFDIESVTAKAGS